MNSPTYIAAKDVEHLLSWSALVESLRCAHQLPRADIDDILFKHGENSLLNRAAWIEGLGIGVKSATIFPGNTKLTPPLPSIHAVFSLLDESTGAPITLIDGILLTRWKTAADSMLGGLLLARPDSRVVTIVGAGAVAESLIDAYREVMPWIECIQVWNRTAAKAIELARKKSVDAVDNLAQALAVSDIVSCATLSATPVIHADWIKAGTHVDLIGAFRPDMREADDALIAASEIFVDARETAIHDIGELAIPIANGVITEQSVRADLYDLCNGAPARGSEQSITLFKNGGGAHLDLMIASYIQHVYASGKPA